MRVADLLLYIKQQRSNANTPQLFMHAHKPINAYVGLLQKTCETPITEMFENIDDLYKAFQKKYTPNSTRNYVRLIVELLELQNVKELYANETHYQNTKEKINKILKEADAVSNKYTTELAKKQKQNESTSADDTDENEPLNIDEIHHVEEVDCQVHKLIESLEQEVACLKQRDTESQEKIKHLETQLKMVELEMTVMFLQRENEHLWKYVHKSS